MQAQNATRRKFLQTAGLGLLAFQVDGAEVSLTPKAAREQAVKFRLLAADEVATVEALGEALLPGARTAGIAHYLDQQLAANPAESLLMLRYLDVPPPYADFYRPAIAATTAFARRKYGKAPDQLTADEITALVTQIAQHNPEGWQGPPAPFFYFVLRSDAVDVVYGTVEGFEKLGIPYMAHIMPSSQW